MAGAVIATACSSPRTSQELPSPSPSTAADESPSPWATGVEAGEEEFTRFFNRVGVELRQLGSLWSQIAIAAAVDDAARADSEEFVSGIVGELETYLTLLALQEPLPQSLAGAGESTELALMKFMEAVSLLLPPESGGAHVFRFRGVHRTPERG